MKCPIDVNRSFGSAFAISAILVNFVFISASTSVCGICFLSKIDAVSPAFPPPALHRLHRYYAAIRLPDYRLASLPFYRLFAILLLAFLTSTCPAEERQGLPSCRVIIGLHAWLSDPGEASPDLPFFFAWRRVVFRSRNTVDLPVSIVFEAPSLSGLHPDCLRLNDTVTIAAPRLAIGGVAFAFPNRGSTC